MSTIRLRKSRRFDAMSIGMSWDIARDETRPMRERVTFGMYLYEIMCRGRRVRRDVCSMLDARLDEIRRVLFYLRWVEEIHRQHRAFMRSQRVAYAIHALLLAGIILVMALAGV